jgi:hypothetical protein
MAQFGLDWVAVVENGQLLGWVDQDALEGHSRVNEVSPRPFSAYVTKNSSLRQALDSIITSRTNVAVVLGDGQEYVGVLTVERISREILA